MRLLLLHHHAKEASALQSQFTQNGFAVDCSLSPSKTLQNLAVNHEDYDSLVLSDGFPDGAAHRLCRMLREHDIPLPTLLLAGDDDPDTIVDGLNAGADDCIASSRPVIELLARVNSLLRRPRKSLPTTLRVDDLELNPATRTITHNRKPLTLTLKQFMVLHFLMRHVNEVISREQLIAHLWDDEYTTFSNIVDAHVKNIRKKLGKSGRELIQTVYGVGYRLRNQENSRYIHNPMIQ